ncbi:hypothetical protein FBEOM_7823 [Fusarium beomiforme]|uniref:Uncharacterized protein n=1 Tax=Fusarium beomiforme TaxID=44412 RepID=A0A9P5AGH9_9HYPO|nr:hypothetical protein FBEOM_7823 [Fusarium beomiforme]
MPAQRSHNPNKVLLRKGTRRLLLEQLAKRLKPSRTELRKVEKEKRQKSSVQASTSSSAARTPTSSRAKRLTVVAVTPDHLPKTPVPPLAGNITGPEAQDWELVTKAPSDIEKPSVIPLKPEGQTQTQTLYTDDYDTFASHISPYVPSLGLSSEGTSQYPATSFISSILQASDLDFDTNDGYLLPDLNQLSSVIDFYTPSLQSPLGSGYAQDFGIPYDLTWNSNMGTPQRVESSIRQEVQKTLPPPPPSISSSSSAGQHANLAKATYDDGYFTRQVIGFDNTSEFNFISQTSVDILERSSATIRATVVPPGIYRKTQCPNGTSSTLLYPEMGVATVQYHAYDYIEPMGSHRYVLTEPSAMTQTPAGSTSVRFQRYSILVSL